MSQELTLFDYAGVPTADVTEIRAAAERIKIRMKRTAEDIIEIGRDLIAVKAKLQHGQFLPWIEAEFEMSEAQAQRFMAVAKKFGNQIPQFAGFQPSVLYSLASAPTEVVAQIETRVAAGQHVTVAEIARLKAEHKAEADQLKLEAAETARKLTELEEKSQAKAEAASRREAYLIADKNDLKQRLANIAREVEKRTWEQADQKYEPIVTRAVRERDEAREALAAKVRELTAAMETARAEAERAAGEMAEAEAARLIETRKKELAEIDQAYQRAQRNCQAAHAQEERARQELLQTRKMIEQHQAELARWSSSEGELVDQVKLATEVAEFIGTKMADLMMFDHAPHTAAIDKLTRAAGICSQFSQALQAFASPRVASA